MVGRGIRWHRRRNRAQLGGLTAFLPPAFGPLSCLLGARDMTAVPLVIVPPQRVLDRDEQPAHRGERRRLAAGRAAEQGLPQHQRLRPDGVTSTATPAPHTPATAAKRAWAT